MIFSGISLKLYSRVKAFGMIGCVVYVNICWYMIWIESLYRDTILKEKGKLGYLYRKDFREKFGDLPKKQED